MQMNGLPELLAQAGAATGPSAGDIVTYVLLGIGGLVGLFLVFEELCKLEFVASVRLDVA